MFKRFGKADRYAMKIAKAEALEENHTVRAASYYEQAFQMYPDNPEPLVKKVHMLWRCVQDSIDPRKEADRLVRLFPDLAISYERRGRILASENLFAEAIADYDVSLKMDPDNIDSYKGRGFSLMALGRHEEAVGYYTDALGLNPGYADAHFYLAVTLEKMGRSAESKTHWRAYQQLGKAAATAGALEDLGKYDDALAVLEAYRQHDDRRNYEVYRHIGRVHGLLGNMRASFTNYTKSVRLNDPGGDAERNVKARYLEIEGVRRMIEEMDPSNPGSFFEAASVALFAEWLHTARDMYKTGLLFASEPQACIRVAELSMHDMDYAQAIKYCKLALKMPGSTPADLTACYSMLVECLFDCGRYREGLKHCREAESLDIMDSDMKKYRSKVLDMGDDPADKDQVAGGWTTRWIV